MKLITTNVPAFYKIRLWNEINKREPVVVVFTSKDFYAETRNADFTAGIMEFEHYVLGKGSTFSRLFQLSEIYNSRQWDNVICGGWDTIENLWPLFISSRRRNSIIIESSIYESVTFGVKRLIKNMILKRVSTAFVCGKAHEELLRSLGYKDRVLLTGGCGLLNYVHQPPFVSRNVVKKFVFVGRLIEVKNLEFLISVFNNFPDLELNIIGEGHLKQKLIRMAKPNIHFSGYIANRDLHLIYKNSDVFILPSKSEPWGLVVEEALNNGCPVLLSNKVGCNKDLGTEREGIIFDFDNKQSLIEAIQKITDINYYNQLRKEISKLDFQKRAKYQVDVYFQ